MLHKHTHVEHHPGHQGRIHHSHKKHHTGISRGSKRILHTILIAAVMISLYLEGGKQADWLFLALAVVVEVS